MSAQNDTQAAFMEAMNGLKNMPKSMVALLPKTYVLSYFKRFRIR